VPDPKRRPDQRLSRREQYAAATRQAIVESARMLFAKRGYFATTVNDIAEEAQVAPATVYAVTGGKQALLTELSRMWISEPGIEATQKFFSESDNPRAILLYLAHATRVRREQFGDVMRILIATAPHDQEVAELLRPATELYRGATVMVAERIADLGGLREGLDVPLAADILWFYFGYAAFFTLHEDNGWSYERAEHWLAERACRELLG